jgi:prepilin-type processing-associated H-X9-DG protein
MFACDGIGSTNSTNRAPSEVSGMQLSPIPGTLTLFNNFPSPDYGQLPNPAIALSDIIDNSWNNGNFYGGTASCFDANRHQGKMNIAFCDGHVETRNVLDTNLQNVFIVPPQ